MVYKMKKKKRGYNSFFFYFQAHAERMGERQDSLEGWVAVREHLFDADLVAVPSSPRFCVAYNRVEAQFAVTYVEGERHACDGDRCARAALFSADALRDIHRQLSLVRPALESAFPLPHSRPKSPRGILGLLNLRNGDGRLLLDPSAEEVVCREMEQYLRAALEAAGKRLLFSLLFGEEDYLTDYEEDMQASWLVTRLIGRSDSGRACELSAARIMD